MNSCDRDHSAASSGPALFLTAGVSTRGDRRRAGPANNSLSSVRSLVGSARRRTGPLTPQTLARAREQRLLLSKLGPLGDHPVKIGRLRWFGYGAGEIERVVKRCHD